MKKLVLVLCCAGLALAVVSCSLKMPAQAAIKAGEDALAAVKGEAAKYVPDQLAEAEKMLSEAREALEKGDYKGAMLAAKDVPAKAQALVSAIEARKAELPGIWDEMTKAVPKLISDTKSQVAKAKGLDKEAKDAAGAGVKEMEENWRTAEDAFKKGALLDAVNMAGEVTKKGNEIQGMLAEKLAGK